MKFLLLPALFLSLPAVAQEASAPTWALRAGDTPYDAETLASLPGQSFVFYDDGEAIFGSDGAYYYTYSPANGGGTAWGSYHIATDGSVCVAFVSGATRCDLYVKNRNRTILITEDGQRFPVRQSG